jgi:hypothetical protein
VTTVIIATQQWTSWPEYGGSTWVPIQYLVGLGRLGVTAIWVDHLSRMDPASDVHGVEYLMRRFESTAKGLGFEGRHCVIYDGGRSFFGLDQGELHEFAAAADLLLMLSGRGLEPESSLLKIPKRAYVDMDPGYTQSWTRQVDMGLDQFNVFFTVGLNVSSPDFILSTPGIDWRPIVPPVVLDLWPPHIDESCQRFSTVADWRARQYLKLNGKDYGGKRDEFLRFIRVPLEARQQIEVALTIWPVDYRELGRLNRNNWLTRNPYQYAGDPFSYREFIQHSRAEFSVAKSGYVRSDAGWVSDRSGCYLASGKPVIVQSTGFEGRLPTGKGLLTFQSRGEAVAAIRSVNEDYLAHAQAAREIAEQHFDSDKVLASMLAQAGL